MEQLKQLIGPAFLDTLYMVGISSFLAILIGLPLALILYLTRENGLKANRSLYNSLSWIVNILRSLPFVILMLLCFPLTRLLVGKIIGTTAAIVPIAIGAAPFVARLLESHFLDIDKGILEAAKSMGASTWQIVTRVILPESLPSIVSSITITIITIVSYSAMAGMLGGGGLGDVAIVYGYQMRQFDKMYVAVFCIILLVQIIQLIGNSIVKRVNKKI